MAPTSNIKVCVRVRPFNTREIDLQDKLCVQMPSDTPSMVILTDSTGTEKTYNFDRAYWSHKPTDCHFCAQETLMQELGETLMMNATDGFNNTLFAYGQTGSGKTFSVLGAQSPELRGLLPRIVDGLFVKIGDEKSKPEGERSVFKVSVSYLEVYQDKLKDLLAPPSEEKPLTIHTSPKFGVFVENLKDAPVFDERDVQRLLDFGMKARSVAATSMNDQSSRSHCIFTFDILKTKKDAEGKQSTLRAKVNLVDLAGSERQGKTQATGQRLQEGSAINKSLTVLARVTQELAKQGARSSSGPRGSKGSSEKAPRQEHVPFRDSKLTHLLQDSLSGNSKTVMIAALSPALSNYDETLSTLRFAEGVKCIKTRALKNEESAESTVDALRAEIARLKDLVAQGSVGEGAVSALENVAMKHLKTQQQRRADAETLFRSQDVALENMGLSVSALTQSCRSSGITDSTPQLVNMSDDMALNACLVYFLPKGEPIALGADESNKIRLQGIGIAARVATIENRDDKDLVIHTEPEGRVLVNGYSIPASSSRALSSGDRLDIGFWRLRVNLPLEPGLADAEAKASQAVLEDTERMLAEFMPTDPVAQGACVAFLAMIRRQCGCTKAQAFLQCFRAVLQQVDEANRITQDLRGSERLLFGVECVMDIFHNSLPHLVVRLKKYSTGAARWALIVRCKVMKRVNLMDAISALKYGGDYADEPFRTVVLLELSIFRKRLLALRKLHERWSRAGQFFLDDIPENDPWDQVDRWRASSSAAGSPSALADLRSKAYADTMGAAGMRSQLFESLRPSARSSPQSSPTGSSKKLESKVSSSQPTPQPSPALVTRCSATAMRGGSASHSLVQMDAQIKALKKQLELPRSNVAGPQGSPGSTNAILFKDTSAGQLNVGMPSWPDGGLTPPGTPPVQSSSSPALAPALLAGLKEMSSSISQHNNAMRSLREQIRGL